MAGSVHVYGMREFLRALRAEDARLPREVKAGFDAIGQEILVPEVQRRLRSLIKESKGHGLLPSARARSTQKEGRVMLGFDKRVPHAGWWEFGGSTHSPRGNTFRERVPGGRTVYPAFSAKADEIAVLLDRLLDRMAIRLEN